MSIHPLSKIDQFPEKKLTKEDMLTFLDYCYKECGGYFLVGSITSHDQPSKNLFNYFHKTNPELFTELDDHSHLDYFFDELDEQYVKVKILRLSKAYGLKRRINSPSPKMASDLYDLYRFLMKSTLFPEWIFPDDPNDSNTGYVFSEMLNPDTGEFFDIFVDRVVTSPGEDEVNKAIVCLPSRAKELVSNGFEYVFIPEVFEGKIYKRFANLICSTLEKQTNRSKSLSKESRTKKGSKVEAKKESKTTLSLSHLEEDTPFSKLRSTFHIGEMNYPGAYIFGKEYENQHLRAEEKFNFDREIIAENDISINDIDMNTGKVSGTITYKQKPLPEEFFFGIYRR